MRKSRSAPILIAGFLALVSPRSVAAYDKTAFVAPADKALVVFVQSLAQDENELFVLFDTNKACVAKVRSHEAKVVPMLPGKYTLYVTAYTTQRIDLDLEAGRSYFVLLYTVPKALWRVSEVSPVRRSTDSHRRLKTWLEGSKVTRASEEQCYGKPLDEKTRRIQRRIDDAEDEWKDGDYAYRAQRTMRRNDGLTEEDVDEL